MNTMNTPGFTAALSLGPTGRRYSTHANRGDGQRTVLVPQLGGKGYKGFAGCQMDCADQHPTWTAAQCAKICRDPGHADPSSDSWFNNFLTSTGIDFWEGACASLMPGAVCRVVANEMRRQS